MNAPFSPNWINMLRLLPHGMMHHNANEHPIVRQVREIAPALRHVDDSLLQQRSVTLRKSVAGGMVAAKADSTIAQGFALVNESARRTLNLEYYDVQLAAGYALARGEIAEMATGEGKTLVQALAAFTFALRGQGVHVMTSNAYLAQRDFDQLSPVLERLGLSIGLLCSGSSPVDKRNAYQTDITYGAGFEFGFDYLRDQVALLQQRPPALGQSYQERLLGSETAKPYTMQRGHAFAIIDEVDSVLIDEATTPLVLSAAAKPMNEGARAYTDANRVAARLSEGIDFILDESERRVRLTRQGVETITSDFPPPTLNCLEHPWLIHIEQALFANYMLRRNADYVIASDKVLLVDQSTGRIFADRTLRGGLHQAVEAKEELPITGCQSILGRISRQQYFQLYETLCGMTGTAITSRRELHVIYRLPVTAVPTRLPCQRHVLPTRFFVDKQTKHTAIVEEIKRRFLVGQPVLVGTRTIAESHCLAELLAKQQVPYQLLNGIQDAEEADIVAHAGQQQAVTIATNIAGRGTDIRLEPSVVKLGGLHVIATEPHASARVDRQLFGRCARQGDPGSCQMFVSAEDTLLTTHAPRLAGRIRHAARQTEESDVDFTVALRRLQSKVERMNFEKRRQMLSRDRWMEDLMAKLAGDPSGSASW